MTGKQGDRRNLCSNESPTTELWKFHSWKKGVFFTFVMEEEPFLLPKSVELSFIRIF